MHSRVSRGRDARRVQDISCRTGTKRATLDRLVVMTHLPRSVPTKLANMHSHVTPRLIIALPESITSLRIFDRRCGGRYGSPQAQLH
jgi:hypothetical protein